MINVSSARVKRQTLRLSHLISVRLTEQKLKLKTLQQSRILKRLIQIYTIARNNYIIKYKRETMHTLQIADKVLDGYRHEKLTADRLDLLITQANEQLDEIAQNKEIYEGFLNKVNAPQKVDRLILWILIMSNESIVDDYIDEFGKNFREIIPVSDLADLLIYAIHLKKLKNEALDGFDYFRI